MGTERVIYGRQERPLEVDLLLKEKGRAVFDILACFYGVTLAR